MSRHSILLFVCVILAAAPYLPVHPAQAAALLVNGDFEGGTHSQPGIVGEVPDGWAAVNLVHSGWQGFDLAQSNPTLCTTRNLNFGTVQCYPGGNTGWVERIDGENSWTIAAENYYPEGRPFETVVYQTVEGVTPGRPYSFTGWVWLLFGGSAWPDNNGGRTVPDDPYSIGAWVGIDPTGGTDPQAATVEWGGQTWTNFKIVNLRAASIAQGSRITVFVRFLSKWPQSATTVHLDGFNLQPAPEAIVEPLPERSVSPVTLRWQRIVPPDLNAKVDFTLFSDVQRQNPDGSWSTLLEETLNDNFTIEAAPGERVTLRVVPESWVPKGAVRGYWPPSKFKGVPSAPVTTLIEPVVVDRTPPVATITALPVWSGAAPFPVEWSATDEGTGIQSYDVEWRLGDGAWQPWLSGTGATSALFGESGQPRALEGGETISVRARAQDGAGNTGEWTDEARTNVAGAWLTGRVVGNRGEPVLGARVTSDPYRFPVPVPPAGADGRYRLPLPNVGQYTIRVEHGAAALPPTVLAADAPTNTADWLLPPADNIVRDGGFENGGAGWTGTGWLVGASRASGSGSAALTPNGSIVQTVNAVEPGQIALAWRYDGNDGKAKLVIAHGEQEWQVPVGKSPARWVYWFGSSATTGSQPLHFSLEARSGTLALDDISLGSPQAEPERVYVPLVQTAKSR